MWSIKTGIKVNDGKVEACGCSAATLLPEVGLDKHGIHACLLLAESQARVSSGR
jgi:hypothetical protein